MSKEPNFLPRGRNTLDTFVHGDRPVTTLVRCRQKGWTSGNRFCTHLQRRIQHQVIRRPFLRNSFDALRRQRTMQLFHLRVKDLHILRFHWKDPFSQHRDLLLFLRVCHGSYDQTRFLVSHVEFMTFLNGSDRLQSKGLLGAKHGHNFLVLHQHGLTTACSAHMWFLRGGRCYDNVVHKQVHRGTDDSKGGPLQVRL